MNLWTVGCADPRLTAPARSPMDKPGKTPCVSPALPTGRRLPTSFTARHNNTYLGIILADLGRRDEAMAAMVPVVWTASGEE